MKRRYYERDEKRGLLEDIIFEHELNEDIGLIERTGYSTEFVHICVLLAIAILAALCF